MAANGKHEQLRLGFLTAIEVPDKGFVGGLLVTNHFGRPLEFQCTAPVRANATQEILYGPTLAPFVLGELIGGALVGEAAVKPDLILTDREPILELRNCIEAPVALVESAPSESDDGAGPNPPLVKLGRQRVRFHAAHGDDGAAVSRAAPHVPADADLLEPFERVREALRETIRHGTMR
ncbi:MAG: hypothetical protein ACT4QC_08235 [Planctomycetaceae bacterium]